VAARELIPGFAVLMYHGVSRDRARALPASERKYWVTAAQLREHLLCIQVGRLPRGQALRALRLRHDCPRQRSAALSFDDGGPRTTRSPFRTVGGWCDCRLLRQHRKHRYAGLRRLGADRGDAAGGHVLSVTRPRARGPVEIDDTSSSRSHESKRRPEDRLASAPRGVLGRTVRALRPARPRALREQGFSAVCMSQCMAARAGARSSGGPRSIATPGTRNPPDRDTPPRALPVRAARAGLIYLPKRVVLRSAPPPAGARILEERA
jgi:hypothetical protein